MSDTSDASLTKKLDDIVRELRVPSVLAHAFCDMSDGQQAEFFAEVARIARTWDGAGLYLQSHSIGRNIKMNDDVREMLMTILVSAEEK